MKNSSASRPTVQESSFFAELPENKVECTLCEHRCKLDLEESGLCGTRKNIDGKLYTLVYGDLSAIESRPIEMKPFFHFWPGSTALTLSTWSCNLNCPWCQNFHLSKVKPDPETAVFYSTSSIIDMAEGRSDDGLCISFQEPTLLTDWVVPLFKSASQKGLYGCFVSNGLISTEALKTLQEAGLTGLKVDIKGDPETYSKYFDKIDVRRIWEKARLAKKMNIHLEIVNLVVTDVNDNEACIEDVIEQHLKSVGPDTPLHFVRYYPAYKFNKPPTRAEVLERAYTMARESGVQFPYVGNLLGHKYESTYCPDCGATLVRRRGYKIESYTITKDKKCPKCGQSIPVQGKHIRKSRGYFVA
jgi:pyruvate formate lyase activating enzyme